MVRRLSGLCLALMPLAGLCAQAVEDDAHREDRLRTEALNRAANRAVVERDRAFLRPEGDAPDASGAQRDYAEAQARYRRRLAAWRAQVAACEQGDWSACDTR